MHAICTVTRAGRVPAEATKNNRAGERGQSEQVAVRPNQASTDHSNIFRRDAARFRHGTPVTRRPSERHSR